MKLVTIIIPVYNVEKYLSKCIRSVLNQSYKNLEVILVDDGSNDDSLLICKRFREKDDRIKLYHTDNFGLSHARNIGLDHANGDYIVFVDSDDYVNKNMIDIMMTKSDNTDLVICNYEKVQSNGIAEVSQDKQVLKDEIWNTDNFWEHYYIDGLGIFCCVAWNKLYKKKIFDNVRFPIGKIHEDEYIINKIVNRCNSIKVIKNSLYYYVQRPGSIMHENHQENFDVAEIYLNRCSSFQKNHQIDVIKSNLLIIPFYMVNGLYESQDKEKSKEKFNLMKKKYFYFVKECLKKKFIFKLYLKQLVLIIPSVYYSYLKFKNYINIK